MGGVGLMGGMGRDGVGDGGGKYATGVHGGRGWEGAGIGALLGGCNSIAAYGTGEMKEMEWIWLIDRWLRWFEGVKLQQAGN